MAKDRQTDKLAVILHTDVAGSTRMVHQDEQLAHECIQGTFHRFDDTITKYHGYVRQLRGDALLAEFECALDAVTAVLAFQADQVGRNIVVIHLRIIAVRRRICDASGIFD